MSIIPNAVNYDLFKPMDKNRCKEKLGIPAHKFVVGFVGYFEHRKGPNRVIEAIKKLNDKDIQLVCVGGKETLTPNDFTISIPPIANYQLPEIYNTFNIFVLPTLSEGHCNAIEEAKACCVPVVSSLGTSVESQMDDSIGILINPLQIDEIASAIKNLKQNNTLLQSMIENLKLRRGERSLENRAKTISTLLENTVNHS
jgi:glycosyltransferase involved in cell wall biosynthesis